MDQKQKDFLVGYKRQGKLVELDNREQKMVFNAMVYLVESSYSSMTEEELCEEEMWGMFVDYNHIIDVLVAIGGLREPDTNTYNLARKFYNDEVDRMIALANSEVEV